MIFAEPVQVGIEEQPGIKMCRWQGSKECEGLFFHEINKRRSLTKAAKNGLWAVNTNGKESRFCLFGIRIGIKMIVFCYRFISQINTSFRVESFIASLLPPTIVCISMQKLQSNVVLRLLCCYHARCIHNSPFLGTLPPTPNQIHPLNKYKQERQKP